MRSLLIVALFLLLFPKSGFAAAREELRSRPPEFRVKIECADPRALSIHATTKFYRYDEDGVRKTGCATVLPAFKEDLMRSADDGSAAYFAITLRHIPFDEWGDVGGVKVRYRLASGGFFQVSRL